ncbi:protein MpLEA-like47 [Marchantia polymorpha subsp. ruderalis]|uniref:Uncharacterized protein n=2 Tax=Marchantia polymorpha TaxID=3197 RepID=A0AAF6BNT6_MARPO|nr:hypothetical protein MARPO_2488s0001 [Marchantia polymorpha]BBN13670.1 hypothetical protein Mp_6g05470 [Marchantia polymorpha subsp. ruderalis]|eukprot:PTQ26359.1 hypothetical protein MARPO_2488s0001 [Marchantia polymorpha]
MGSAKDFAAHTTEQTKNFVAEKTGQAEALAEGLGQAAKPKHKTSRFVRKAGDKVMETFTIISVCKGYCAWCNDG